MTELLKKLSPDFKNDLEKAIKILHEAGCTEIFLFGSIAYGQVDKNSDIDIAVKGCSPKLFFKVLGQLLVELDHSVDLIDLDDKNRFGNFLINNGELVRVA